MTFKVTVTVQTSPSMVPVSTPEAAFTRVEILDVNGATVALQDKDYVFTGVAEGEYTAKASLFDVDGNVIGTPVTQAFTIKPDSGMKTIDIPSGLTISFVPE